MTERPTFSPFWHRVRSMRPRLRSHVEITRQRYRGRRWHVVHDPASNQFYRLNPVAYEFIGLLDGSRDVDTAWKIALSKFGDAAPTQNEVIQLISQLYSANLLSADAPPETEQLLRRGRERVRKKIQQQAIGIMYFRIRLFNPDRILAALEPVFRPILNRWGMLAWAALIGFALYWLTANGAWSTLLDPDSVAGAIAPANWPWLIVVFVVLKLIHESGHGLICKRFGGQVPEFGLMMLVLFPSPYVDASAAWGFADKWKRIAVGAGGMIFELAVAAVAAIVWVGSGEGVVKQVAYNAMFTASIATVLFNANPLMRFDGYYMLADLLETPNLAQRANQMMKHLLQKYVYRLERPSALLPSTLRGEQVILVVYGLAALAYRIFLFITITLYVMGVAFGLGLVLAIWTAAAWFIIPIGGFIHWLAANPCLSEQRLRAVGVSAALIGAAVIAVGVIPMPDRRRGAGVVESERRSGVYIATDGFVEQVHARPGDRVRAGDPILTLDSLEMLEQRRQTLAAIGELRIQERAALREGNPAVAQVARERIAVYQSTLAEVDRKIAELVVRAPHDGVVVTADPARLLGAYVRRGDPVCEVIDQDAVRIAATLGQDATWLFDPSAGPYTVRLRLYSAADKVIDGTNVREPPAGRKELASPALGFAGGGQIETEPDDRTGQVAKRPTFTVHIDPVFDDAASVWHGAVGQRVKVRFELPDKPLIVQWADRLARTMQGRVNL